MTNKVDFYISDWVSFHTQYGYRTGLIELILHGEKGKKPQRAIITVRNLSGKPKKYIRPLYKLKKVVL